MPVNGHSRKGSLLVGEGIDIKKGPIAFGSVDSPNAFLSSSPAKPSLIGGHLADSVQSFGSLPADSSTSGNDVVKDSRRPTNMTTTTTNPGGKKPFDVHQFFTKPAAQQPQHQQQQPSQQQPGNPAASPNPITSPPPSANGHGMPPSQYRPPVQQQMMPQQGGPMRPQNGPYPPRPMMMGQQQPGMPQYGQHGGPQNPYMMQQYPGYGYYPGGFEQHYAPQWQQQAQQHRQGQPNFGMSPRGNQSGLPAPSQPSPAHPSASLPGNGSLSPVPTPPSRPHSHLAHPVPSSAASGPSMPGTPGARPPSQPPIANFVPQQQQQQGPPTGFGLSGGASTFTPRKSAAIAIRRPDGTVLDTKPTPASSSAATPTKASNGTNTSEDSAAQKTEQPSAIKKKGPFPVMVRIESEDAKKARLAEEATAEKCRKEDEKYEAEKKERKARQAREAEEKRVAEEAKAKEDSDKAAADSKAAEEQKKLDETKKAEEAALKKQAEEAAAAKAAKDAEDKKAEEDKVARAKAAEQASAQPAVGSASGSTPSSPQSAATGLPPKPSSTATPAAVAGPSGARRSVPAPLDLQPTTPRTPVQDAQPSALATAKPITDLDAVNYQSPIQSPDSTLQKGAEPGKFRYDRDFLMQFMSVCKEKPASLPPLEEIGLEADTSSGFGKRGPRSSVAGTPRSSTGLGTAGAGGSQQRFPSQGMGSFGTGSFGSGQIGSSIRGTTSEDRYRSSMANAGRGGAAGGGRTPSQQGMLPPMSTSGSRFGGRGSNRGTKRPPQASSFQANDNANVQALQTSENAWVTAGRKLGEDDKRSPTYISRKVKSLLNKLTAEKFDSISDQVLEYVNYSVDEDHPVSMKLVIQLIFEKATDEALWGAMYAKLCKKMMNEVDQAVTETIDGKATSGGMLFRKYLVGRCQLDFEAGWKEREAAVAKAAEKGEDDQARLTEQAEGKSSEPAVLSDEYYALQKIKRRGLGLIQLIGELFKLEMVNKNVMKGCFVKLLGHLHETDEEDVESACKLLKTIGPIYDQQSGDNVSGIIVRLEQIAADEKTANRIKFMIQDIVELRDAGWRGKAAGPQSSTMTIAEVHQAAAREQAQQRASTQSVSRNGSRAGQPRGGGNDWQPAPTQPRPSRPADMSQLGRIASTNAAPTFSGPQSAFGRNRRGGGAGNQSTPPISRQASQANIPSMSNANQFALLNDANEAADSTEAGPQRQRQRLNLAPRTVPVDGEGGDAAAAAEGEGEDAAEGSEDQDGESSAESDEVSTPKPMTETAAKAKIDLDMTELWGEKDSGGSRNPDDIVHYFRALPEHHRPLLSSKLYDEVFRTAKLKDAEIVAKGLASAVGEGAASSEIVKKGLEGRMVSLDDDSIDFPQAYKAIAVIMRRLSLSQEDIDDLTGKIDVYGEPKITPKMKLDRALASVDEEAAAASA